MATEAELRSPMHPTSEALVVQRAIGRCPGEELQVLRFAVKLVDLLSTLLRCHVFARTQKAVVDQTGSRPPDSDHDVFLVQIWLWEMLWSFFSVQPLSWSFLVVI